MIKLIAGLLVASALAPAALAEVKAAAPDGLIIEHRADVAITREALWARLVTPSLWWSGAHSYSRSSANFSLKPVAGGCWCEIWKGGSVEHGRVIAVMPNQLLRLDTAMGPLQELGVKGVLTFTIEDANTAGHISVVMTYRVVGSALSKLDAMSAPVDQVLGEQFDHLVHPIPERAAPKAKDASH